MKTEEIEVKFYIKDLASIEARLRALGAKLAQPRTHEINLRFDTSDGALAKASQVLRLRQDERARLTFKGPGQDQEGVRSRREIEFTVGDFEMAQVFLEALGYQVVVMYEKFRATYHLDGADITLDEMPYGNFIEIEGPDAASIQNLNTRLGLDWDARILESYILLFERLRARLGFEFRDLAFENFKGLPVTVADLAVSSADQS